MKPDRRLLRRYLTSYALSQFGTGLWLPMNAVYLVEVLDFPEAKVGLFYAVNALTTIGSNLVSGPLADRFGPRVPFVTAGLLQAAGIALLVVAPSAGFALMAGAVSGLGNGAFFAVQAAVIARLFGKESLSIVLGHQYQLMNLGMGLGALLLGGLIQSLGTVGYVVGFGLNAVSYAAHVLNVSGPLRRARPADAAPSSVGPRPVRHPFRPYLDRAFLPLLALQLGIVFFGYAQMEAAFPLVFKQSGHLPVWAITAYVAANCAAVIVFQPSATRIVQRTGGQVAIAWALACWVVSVIPALALTLDVPLAARVVLVCLFGIVFAVGESLIAPSIQPLAAKAAPEGQLTTYTAAVSALHGVGMMAGPAALLPVFAAFGAIPYWMVLAGGAAVSIALTRLIPTARRPARAVEESAAVG